MPMCRCSELRDAKKISSGDLTGDDIVIDIVVKSCTIDAFVWTRLKSL